MDFDCGGFNFLKKQFFERQADVLKHGFPGITQLGAVGFALGQYRSPLPGS